jgi:hypothetical protein
MWLLPIAAAIVASALGGIIANVLPNMQMPCGLSSSPTSYKAPLFPFLCSVCSSTYSVSCCITCRLR